MSVKNLHKILFFSVIILSPCLLPGQGLHIMNGGNLVMSGPVHMVLVDGSFVNDGSFASGNSNLLFTGIKSALIAGDHVSAFNNITIQKSSNSVQLKNDININGAVTMRRGLLLLNNRTLNLGGTGSIEGENSHTYITGANGGSISVTRTLKGSASLNPGNIGAELSNAPNAGVVTIIRSNVPMDLPNGGQGINRSFNIVASGNKDLNVTLRFFYLDPELAGNEEAGLLLWGPSGAGNFLVPIGADNRDTVANWVIKSGLNSLGTFTLAGPMGAASSGLKNTPAAGSSDRINGYAPAIRLYPNPSRGQFNVEIVTNLEKEVVMKLVDQSGQVLEQRKIHCRADIIITSWDINRYAAGVYYLVFDSSAFKTVKIIKE